MYTWIGLVSMSAVPRILKWLCTDCILDTVLSLLIESDLKWCIQLRRSLFFIFQLLGEYHCWWTRKSPRAHVAKFYGRPRLISSVWEHQNFSELKLIEIIILRVYYTIPFGFSLLRHFFSSFFHFLKLLCLAKDYWRGFSTRNAHMVHVVN